MTSILIRLFAAEPNERITAERAVAWPGVPRVGERVNVDDPIGYLDVEAVNWDLNGSVLVELRGLMEGEAGALEEDGWTVTRPPLPERPEPPLPARTGG